MRETNRSRSAAWAIRRFASRAASPLPNALGRSRGDISTRNGPRISGVARDLTWRRELWEERAGRNEALFREVNERIEELRGRLRSDDETGDFVCECADEACTERIPVALRTYERVRSNPRQFIIHPGHQEPDIERVVDAADRFLIVEKLGAAGRVATTTDPRQ